MISTVRQSPRPLRLALAAAAALLAFAASAGYAKAPTLQMLDRLQPGLWELRPHDAGTPQRVCVPNGRALIQLRHPGAMCRPFVVEDSEARVTVQYTCPGAGYGRTTIRFETTTLAQVDTQGISGGTPFDFSAEARRVGNCSD